MWCFPQLCSDERQKIHWVAVSLQKPALAQSTSAVDESEIIFHLEKHSTETQGVIFGLCNLESFKVFTLPAGIYSAVVCLANKPWESPDPIHQVFTSACTRNTSVAFLNS